MNALKKAALVITLAIPFGGPAVAQNSSSSTGGTAVISGTTSPINRGVVNKPYSATETSDWRRTLADGTYIEQKQTIKLARDSQGRECREEWRVVDGDAENPILFSVSIVDPVAGVRWILQPRTREAFRNTIPQPQPPKPLPLPAAPSAPNLRAPSKAAGPQIHGERIGMQEIEGYEARGTRTTTIIPTGWEGNSAPITTVSETWVSTDLGIVLMSKKTDPADGDTTIQVSEIDRAEPDPTRFQVPADYTIHDQ